MSGHYCDKTLSCEDVIVGGHDHEGVILKESIIFESTLS